MATEILQPQDCLARQMGASSPAAYPHRRRSGYRSSYANPRPNRRHHQHPPRKRPVVPCQLEQARPGGLVTGKAAVLRRGDGPVVISGSSPKPEMARKQDIATGPRSPAAVGVRRVAEAEIASAAVVFEGEEEAGALGRRFGHQGPPAVAPARSPVRKTKSSFEYRQV